MKIHLEVKYLDLRGETHKLVEVLEVDKDFQDKILEPFDDILINLKITKEEQYDDYISDRPDEFIKPIMDKYDMLSVINYEIIHIGEMLPKKVKKVKFEQYASELLEIHFKGEHKQQQIIDFLAVYSNMKTTLKGLSNKKKFEIVLNSMNVGYSSQIKVYKDMNTFNRKLDLIFELNKKHGLNTHDYEIKNNNGQITVEYRINLENTIRNEGIFDKLMENDIKVRFISYVNS